MLEIETAAMRAWPEVERVAEAGWILRFSSGYTRRANCATPLTARDEDLEERLAWCERQFEVRSLPPIFRILSACAPARVDKLLAASGYQRVDESLVMTLDVSGGWPRPSVERAEPLSMDAWLDVFHGFAGGRGGAREMHRDLLERIRGEALFAVIREGGQPVGCGLAVRDGADAGLFDLSVGAEFRGRGHGRRLVGGLLRWSAERGARRAYLQVLAANHVAVGLYASLGFRAAYRYWYRVPAVR